MIQTPVDGHGLYHALADQLQTTPLTEKLTHLQMCSLLCDHMEKKQGHVFGFLHGRLLRIPGRAKKQ